jgi:ATP-dependent Lon protease
MFFKEKKNQKEKEQSNPLPLMPLRDLVVFPYMVVPLIVGRSSSIQALEEAITTNKLIILAAQKEAGLENPTDTDIHSFGTEATIIQKLSLPDGTVKVLVEGKRRVQINKFIQSEPCFIVDVTRFECDVEQSDESDALVGAVKDSFEVYVKLNRSIPPEVLLSISTIKTPGRLADTLVAQLNIQISERQALLELSEPIARLQRLQKFIQSEIEILQVEKKIKKRVKKQVEKSQKEYYLNEQMEAIQRELGEKDEFKSEMAELLDRVKEAPLSEEARGRLGKELRKLKMMSPMSAEASVVRNYVDTVLSLPWHKYGAERVDIANSARILDRDHFGLKKVKERILEYIAVSSLVERLQGPILCLVGPPGVGKTSLAKSIAQATNRDFVRLSLGGVRDEAEIRGHRRTYIGALPGKLIMAMKKAGTSNPVFLLDEVDKMSSDMRGDPASALLEVLDPEQNDTFNDHYLDMDYDLSKVLFVCTANSLSGIPVPLQDRLEIIRLPGYTENEKLSIAKKYLIPKQIEAHGITGDNISISKEAATKVIRRYTKEAGVRNLNRELASICRKVAKQVVESGKETSVKVTSSYVETLLGVPKFRYGKIGQADETGFVNGLAWTNAGGVMVPIEAAAVYGSGKTTLTGQLGDVFQESSQAAITYIRSRASNLGLEPDFYQKLDIHVHVPELWGVDGPSAGITIATAVVSAVTGLSVKKEIAMTGEITLRGRVRPIGGLKEKLLAAKRAGITVVIIPKDNEQDLTEVPKVLLEELTILPVEHMDEVLKLALAISDPSELFPEPASASSQQVSV